MNDDVWYLSSLNQLYFQFQIWAAHNSSFYKIECVWYSKEGRLVLETEKNLLKEEQWRSELFMSRFVLFCFT